MFEDSERVRDMVKISQLPEHQRKDWQSFVIQRIIINLIDCLKDELLSALDQKEIARDLDPSIMTIPTHALAHGLVPSPKEIREMIPLLDFWGRFVTPQTDLTSLPSFIQTPQLMFKVQELADLIVGKIDPTMQP